jgi:hypothetical protein
MDNDRGLSLASLRDYFAVALLVPLTASFIGKLDVRHSRHSA